jgi:hypothetical protein
MTRSPGGCARAPGRRRALRWRRRIGAGRAPRVPRARLSRFLASIAGPRRGPAVSARVASYRKGPLSWGLLESDRPRACRSVAPRSAACVSNRLAAARPPSHARRRHGWNSGDQFDSLDWDQDGLANTTTERVAPPSRPTSERHLLAGCSRRSESCGPRAPERPRRLDRRWTLIRSDVRYSAFTSDEGVLRANGGEQIECGARVRW